ncbi:hypothetical protein HMPREF9318_01501 [Streptococcus urinalis FB127-CNA-2]|uniref:Acetyltransferase, GNAT family n=1 Tax=Streptococcus urinalis 2285-97 TaxID=764291 RepID=G5KDN8_9STRE|nr:GNAT family protein [Streptococcus urinalis]EHJ55666.1 acetyltransferase, GNAT family [Streptococcus urinalis 2285-97]EKS19425.1 hypothetical protein HMPREF9318_01501 [Streptococcus urinalis FB127-CNA-2]VEF31557.1 acetyltransferase (GNAT) family protein [Streptococcus urinalis]
MDIWTLLAKFATFETNELILRPIRYEDSDSFWNMRSKSSDYPFVFSDDVDRNTSDFILVHSFMKKPLGVWAIENKVTHTMIGCIRFEKIDSQNLTAEIGYFINKGFQRKGYGKQALNCITFLAFHELAFKKLSLIIHKENVASQLLAKSCQYKFVRYFKGSDRHTHKIRDYALFELLVGEYHHE